MSGIKFDSDKLKWSLLPLAAMEDVVKVINFGAQKYSKDGWRSVEPERYRDALMRHLMAVWIGEEEDDPESGLSHYAHAMCNLIFLSILEKKTVVKSRNQFDKYKSQINPVD
jgi:hypothetical protein